MWEAVAAVAALVLYWLIEEAPRRRARKELEREEARTRRFNEDLLLGRADSVSRLLARRVRGVEARRRLEGKRAGEVSAPRDEDSASGGGAGLYAHPARRGLPRGRRLPFENL